MYHIEIETELLWALHWGSQYSVQDIADEFGVGLSTIRRRMIKQGVPRRVGCRKMEFEPNYQDRAIFRALEQSKKRSRILDRALEQYSLRKRRIRNTHNNETFK